MDKIQKRFDELEAMAKQVASSLGIKVIQEYDETWATAWTLEKPPGSVSHEVETIDNSLFEQWRISVLNLLEQVYGPSKATYREFAEYSISYLSTAQFFHGLMPIFQAAKEDFEGGYLFDVKNLVHAEVFSDELEQAKHFLDNGFKVPAAVIAGTVLETSLRSLCEQHPELAPADNINRMNDELKVKVYNQIVHRQIQGWGDIRNAAAHGHPEDFEPAQVNQMITGIRDFIANQLS